MILPDVRMAVPFDTLAPRFGACEATNGARRSSLPGPAMKMLFATAILVVVTPLAARAQSDLALLQGAWTMVSGSMEGVALPPEYVRGSRRVMTGSKLTVTVNGRPDLTATVTLDPTRSPKTIDYHIAGGKVAGSTQLGIYQISGDTVRFCFAASNATRPTSFTTVAGDGRVLSTWVRTR